MKAITKRLVNMEGIMKQVVKINYNMIKNANPIEAPRLYRAFINQGKPVQALTVSITKQEAEQAYKDMEHATK